MKTPFFEVTAAFALSTGVQGRPDVLLGLVRALSPAAVFYEWVRLSPEEFSFWSDGQDMDGFGDVRMQPFHTYLDQPFELGVYVVMQGQVLRWSGEAPWWARFETALESVRLEHEGAGPVRREAEAARRRAERAVVQETLEAHLPTDERFGSLSQEPRARITALRQRADEVLLAAGLPFKVSGGETELLHRLARSLKARRRKSTS